MNETLRTIYGLHSTHGNFTARDISDENLQTIIMAGVRASNASNRQSYSIIVVEDKADMKDYLQYVGSKALIFCVDYTRLSDMADYLGHPDNFNGIVDFIIGSTDTALAAQTAAIAAKSLGIDYLFTNSVHRGDMDRFYRKFNLPEKHCFPVIALILGYSDKENTAIRGRLEGPGIVHYGTYQRLDEKGISEVVDQYDVPEKHMGVRFYESAEPNLYKGYMDWYFKKWCSPESDRRKQKRQEIISLLNKAGFIE